MTLSNKSTVTRKDETKLPMLTNKTSIAATSAEASDLGAAIKQRQKSLHPKFNSSLDVMNSGFPAKSIQSPTNKALNKHGSTD